MTTKTRRKTASPEELRFRKLKRAAEKLERETLQAEAEWSVMMKRLQDEFECDTLEDADVLLKRLQSQEKKKRKELTEAMDQFEETWNEHLGEDDEELDDED